MMATSHGFLTRSHGNQVPLRDHLLQGVPLLLTPLL